MKLIQLIKDFLQWRKEKYDKAFRNICKAIADTNKLDVYSSWDDYYRGLIYGINHRDEILKKVKI